MNRLVIRLASPVVAALLASTGLCAVTPSIAVAADAHIILPLYDFRDLVVDDAHGHVFVSGGAGDPLVVRDMDGGPVATIPNQPGAGHMALSTDSSKLYVPLEMGDAVSVIDTTTLQETARYRTGPVTCPTSVAVVGMTLWFAYGCDYGTANIGAISLGGTPTVSLGKVAPGTFTYVPRLDSTANLADRLLALDSGTTTGPWLFDVSSDTPSVIAHGPSFQGGLTDFDLDPDGSRLLVAPYQQAPVTALSTTLLSPIADYPDNSVSTGNAVAAGPGGLVAIGYSSSYKDVVVHRKDGAVLRNYDLPTVDGSGVPADSLAFSADAGRLFAVGIGPNQLIYLNVLHNPTTAVADIAWTPPTSTLYVNRPFALTGKLSSSLPIPAGAVITVLRDSLSGPAQRPSVVTSATGAFTISDTVASRGTYGYTASWAGDADHAGTSKRFVVTVRGLTPSISITTGPGPWAYGSKPAITAHFASTQSRGMSIYAQPYQGTKVKIQAGLTNSQGNLWVPYTMSVRTTFTAVFTGDSTYEPRTVTKTLTSYAQVVSSLTRHYGTSGSYKLFRTSVDPLLLVTTRPVYSPPTCVDFEIQTYVYGAWRLTAALTCAKPDAYGRTGVIYPSKDPAGRLFRMRALFRQTAWNVNTYGAWQYGKFTT